MLGAFRGKPAVVHIEYGKGVCGTAAQSNTTQVVANVHECKNHIACDSDSKSEIVIPSMYYVCIMYVYVMYVCMCI